MPTFQPPGGGPSASMHLSTHALGDCITRIECWGREAVCLGGNGFWQKTVNFVKEFDFQATQEK
jgi:hypothetical protein